MAKTQDESNELYESIMETLEILGDAEVMAALHDLGSVLDRNDEVAFTPLSPDGVQLATAACAIYRWVSPEAATSRCFAA